MTISLIKNEELLEETHKVVDLLNTNDVRSGFRKKLLEVHDRSIIGIVGKYGSGKSTMLYQLKEENDKNETWVFFDAWKFPERNNLWEGFVLDVVKELEPTVFDEVRKKIDGQASDSGKLLVKVISQGLNIFQPGASIVENFTGLFKSSPVKRVYEFQEILEGFINKLKIEQKLIIVVEDVDRSGDKGTYFLETLRLFLKNSSLNKKIIIIVPIGDKSYKENEESFLKTLDYTLDFDISKIDYITFINNVFNEEVFSLSEITNNIWIDQLNFLFKAVISEEKVTIRGLKKMIRNSAVNYHSLDISNKENINPVIFLGFAFAKQLEKNIIGGTTNGNMQFRKDSAIWLYNLLRIVASRQANISNRIPEAEAFFSSYNDMNIPIFESEYFDLSRQNVKSVLYIPLIYQKLYQIL